MNRNFRKTALLMGTMAFLGLGYSSNAYAAESPQEVQQATKKITGTVVDAQGPVIGASVVEKGKTGNGVITDFDGKFTLNVNPGATIVVSYVGYQTQEIKVGNQSSINITLKEDDALLEEVVVVGYGTMKKKLVTGATVQVKGEDIAKLNTTNALEAMQSSTPGVQITQSSSQPGKGYKVTIRGIGTTGNSTPLYVIDGVAGGNLDGINPNDIESIDVLKDAASAAIYGARAANGVILVTTKQGKAGKIELSYNGAMGWSNAYKRPQLLNAQQYMTIIDEYNFNVNGEKMDWAGFVPQDILNKVANGWEGTDWWGAFENKNAIQQNHSVSLTGGTDRSKFAMSYTYTGNEGIMGADQASYYKRHTIRINSDHVLLKAKDFDAITIGENISIGYNKSHDLAEDGMYWSYIHSLLQTCPLVPQYADNGDIYYYQEFDGTEAYGKGWNSSLFSNPWENLTKGGFNSKAESRNFNASATGFLTIQPIKGLRLRSQFNYWWSSGAYRNYNEPRSTGYGNATSTIYSVSQSGSMNTGFSVENTLTYDLPIISGHKISAMVGQSFQSSAWSSNISGSNKVNYGDSIDLIIWERAPSLLFGSKEFNTEDNSVNLQKLPTQVVEDDGMLFVPYIGMFPVVGKTVRDIEAAILKKLAGKANDAQILLQVKNRPSDQVTVLGDVNSSKNISLTPKGERILDAVSLASGVSNSLNKTMISMSRNGKTVDMPLESVIRNPEQNIYLNASDVIVAMYQPWS